MPRRSYYDLDNILAQEELVPCVTLCEFHELAHLDPDARDDNKNASGAASASLAENSKIHMPVWSIDKLATLGYVRPSLPRHFGRSSRERLEADPIGADIRSRNERFFLSGSFVIDLVERCAQATAADSGRTRRHANTTALNQVVKEAAALKQTLLVTYMGERLRRNFNWTLSHIDDDVTNFTKNLTETEQILFRRGAMAATAHERWKQYGNVDTLATTKRTITSPRVKQQRVVSPNREYDDSQPKRQRR